MPFPVDRNRVTCNARFRAGQQAIFAEHRVDHRGLARIRASDNGNAQRLGGIIGRDDFFIRVFDVITDQLADSLRREDLVCGFRFLLIGKDAFFAEKFDNGVAQVGHALTMFR